MQRKCMNVLQFRSQKLVDPAMPADQRHSRKSFRNKHNPKVGFRSVGHVVIAALILIVEVLEFEPGAQFLFNSNLDGHRYFLFYIYQRLSAVAYTASNAA